jgi:ABC-2 type transport system permease protein
VSAFRQSLVFQIAGYYPSPEAIDRLITDGELDAGVVVPRDFGKKSVRGQAVPVQLLVDAVNANTATIAGAYASRIVSTLNANASVVRRPARPAGSVIARLTLLYNPGLKSAWFIATGLIGWLLVVQGSAVASAAMVREKEIGTVEQLLMTPATEGEIVFAKIAPIFLLLALDIGLALSVARVVFDIPMRGSMLLFFACASLCVRPASGSA